MTRLQKQKGFTLVELAIVLTIIGLLIGGILKGQQLMQNSRVTATIAQIQAIESATTTFRDTYRGMPGDIPNGNTRIPGCPAACANASTTGGSHSDGIVGLTTWDLAASQGGTPLPTTGMISSTAIQAETILFWLELAKGGLISGITDDGIAGGTMAFGASHPAARVGGGFVVGYSTGTIATAPGRAALTGAVGGVNNNVTSITGTVLALTLTPTGALAATAGTQVVTPGIAAQIDRKEDDGLPNSGDIQAFGLTANCFGAAAGPYSYLESSIAKDCGIYVKIQG